MRKSYTVIHYYNEIVRFWNKLNFIVKTNIKDPDSIGIDKISEYLYATYRMLWENASENDIINELKDIDKKVLIKLKSFSLNKNLANKNEKEKLSILESVPSFMIDHLLSVMNIDFFKKNIKFMNGLENEIEVTVRINNLHENLSFKEISSKIKESLEYKKIVYREDSDIPELLWIPRSQKNKIIKNSLYQNGYLIFQDKASAAVVEILSPRQEDVICDMCAAPGIKTSLIAQRTDNKCHILAGEFLTERANLMRFLLKKLNVLNVHILNTDSIIFPIRFQNYFDLILLDAPCTGSGSLLNNPELKWRQNKSFLYQNVTLQKKLIESALKLLKPNGVLVFSTCSFYPEEGEYHILEFKDNLIPLNLPKWISPSYKINGSSIPGTGRLFPSVHQTQGFFIGKFKKKE